MFWEIDKDERLLKSRSADDHACLCGEGYRPCASVDIRIHVVTFNKAACIRAHLSSNFSQMSVGQLLEFV